jgi:hypothetical protein
MNDVEQATHVLNNLRWTALSLCGDFTQTIELLTLSPVRWIEG